MDNQHITQERLAEIQARVDALLKLEEDAYLYHIDGNVLGMSLYDFEQTMVSAAQSITNLLAEVARLTAELAQTKRERDAAVHDIKLHPCDSCNFEKKDAECRGRIFGLGEDACHEWRGPCEENAKEDAHAD